MGLPTPVRGKVRHRGEEGYILLTLLLVVALLIIAMAVIVPTIAFEIKRDREEELIHRGVQYARAIRAYYKKFGRYPTKIEDLENTNNLRFLRKRYKDPITGKDFKLLHFGEVKLTFSAGIGGGSIPGANPIGSPGEQNAAGGLGQPSAFGGSTLGATSNSAFGQNQPTNNLQTDASSSSSSSTSGSNPPGTEPGSGSDNSGGGSSAEQPGQTFGGGPIVGVVSFSKKETIREFNQKKKYNEWQFIYDPATDRGGLLMTPNQPPIQGFGQQPGMQNPNGQNNPTGFGNTFGASPTGIQNNPNPTPMNPPANPPEQ